MAHKTASFLSYPVYSGNLNQINFTNKTLINTINQYSFCIAQKDKEFKQALQQSDVLLPDGIAITLSVKFLTGKKINKIAGADVHQYLLNHYNNIAGTCFYLGSSEKTLAKIVARLHNEYPNLKVGTYSPPYKAQFNDEDNHKMIEAVNKFKPDVLFIGLTAPKQEKWAFAHKNELNATTICAIGAVFDFYAGTIPRPSKFWINLGLEWFIRLIKEPKRMWKRYLYYGPIFIASVIKQKIFL
ncbi:MAG: glycosyltransferase [Sphingobacteriales bacterium]|nr:MAG: glycosyltransferase [Sphingobacteriales bacterium]TAF82303.1 MAG: glycosyltransferase [Sphingobacteriales bacterium]